MSTSRLITMSLLKLVPCGSSCRILLCSAYVVDSSVFITPCTTPTEGSSVTSTATIVKAACRAPLPMLRAAVGPRRRKVSSAGDISLEAIMGGFPSWMSASEMQVGESSSQGPRFSTIVTRPLLQDSPGIGGNGAGNRDLETGGAR
eukprot:2681350-Rhodomonas_salina.6